MSKALRQSKPTDGPIEQSDREAAIEAIADQLIDQSDEPWPGGSKSDRLHYWRDKAIIAARKLRNLIPKDQQP